MSTWDSRSGCQSWPAELAEKRRIYIAQEGVGDLGIGLIVLEWVELLWVSIEA